MKTIKTTLLLTLLMGSILTTKAQDATNDATWEETISFINKYKKYISSVGDRFYSYDVSTTSCFGCLNKEVVSVSNTKIIFRKPKESYWRNDYLDGTKTIQYKKVDKIEINLDLLSHTFRKSRHDTSYEYFWLMFSNSYGVNYTGISDKITEEYSKKTYNSYKTVDNENSRSVFLDFSNNDGMPSRLIKAFKHLAFLATEKRKAARKALNEKF